jgi:predicted permease
MAWEYQELLNQCLQILITLALGVGCVWVRAFSAQRDLRTLNLLVFLVLLPASVLLGLGLRSDLRDGDTWRFIGAFIMLRAICLLAAAAIFFRRGIGVVTTNWVNFSWVSTVILGVPLLRAALGPQYANLGVVAGISSFIFQLPVQLFMFEVHAGRQVAAVEEAAAADVEGSEAAADGSEAAPAADVQKRSTFGGISKAQARKICLQLAHNPILWAILGGIILSATTLGPRYLWPGTPPAAVNCDYVPGTGFIALTLTALAACTEPVALFATGVFLARQNPIAIGWIPCILYMVVKLILVPAAMVGCAAAVGLEGAPARGAVLLAALPVSTAAFALADRYRVGTPEAVANIFWGNALVLPTVIAWVAFMDGVGLFPVTTVPTPNVCAAPPAG